MCPDVWMGAQEWDILAEEQLEDSVEGSAVISWRGDGKHFATLSREQPGGKVAASSTPVL